MSKKDNPAKKIKAITNEECECGSPEKECGRENRILEDNFYPLGTSKVDFQDARDYFGFLNVVILADKARGGCVIKGTRVRLASGKEKPIEEIETLIKPDGTMNPNPLDQIRTADGSVAYPLSFAIGPEQIFPTVKIRVISKQDLGTPSKCYCIETTKWHPIMRNQYSLTQAYLLSVGETVLTDTGIGTIYDIQYCRYNGPVYNISLASEKFVHELNDPSGSMANPVKVELVQGLEKHSLMGLKPKEHIIFKNGIASGSFELQLSLTEYLKDGVNINNFS
jgi:hypothetical protein